MVSLMYIIFVFIITVIKPCCLDEGGFIHYHKDRILFFRYRRKLISQNKGALICGDSEGTCGFKLCKKLHLNRATSFTFICHPSVHIALGLIIIILHICYHYSFLCVYCMFIPVQARVSSWSFSILPQPNDCSRLAIECNSWNKLQRHLMWCRSWMDRCYHISTIWCLIITVNNVAGYSRNDWKGHSNVHECN